MRILALDTTTRAGSTALVEDDRVVDQRRGDGARPHAARMPAEITALLEAHRVALADIDLYAVASGPGSFTGLRIGIATIQGLAFVHRRSVVAIPALEALAQMDGIDAPPGTAIAAWTDAHRGEVFAALYRVADAAVFTRERLIEIEGPTVGLPAATLARWTAQFGTLPERFSGDGAVLYQGAILAASPAARVAPSPLLAAAVGRLALARRAEAVAPGMVRALYVRRPDAEIHRDEKLRLLEIDSKAH